MISPQGIDVVFIYFTATLMCYNQRFYKSVSSPKGLGGLPGNAEGKTG
jgi:hypothetical protein